MKPDRYLMLIIVAAAIAAARPASGKACWDNTWDLELVSVTTSDTASTNLAFETARWGEPATWHGDALGGGLRVEGTATRDVLILQLEHMP